MAIIDIPAIRIIGIQNKNGMANLFEGSRGQISNGRVEDAAEHLLENIAQIFQDRLMRVITSLFKL